METGHDVQERERGNSKGVTSAVVAANVRAIRTDRGLDLAAFSDRLSAIGRPIPIAALSRLENGSRRVDVDDLVALAHALEVSPTTLLSPSSSSQEHAPLATTLPIDLALPEVTAWLKGELASFAPTERLKVWAQVLENNTGYAAQFEAIAKEAQNSLAAFGNENAQLKRVLLEAQQAHQNAVAQVEEAERAIANLTARVDGEND